MALHPILLGIVNKIVLQCRKYLCDELGYSCLQPNVVLTRTLFLGCAFRGRLPSQVNPVVQHLALVNCICIGSCYSELQRLQQGTGNSMYVQWHAVVI